MMNFDILKKLRPDYCIELDQQSKVLSIDNELLKQVNPHPQIIPTFDIPINDFFLQFNKNQLSNYYPDEFINNMSFFIANKNHALVLLNSNILKETQTKGLYLFILTVNRTSSGIKLEFFNLLSLTDLVSKFFSYDLWNTFKEMVAENNHCFVNQQLYMAYQAILPLFLLTNTNEMNIQAKPKWNELGELLFYFNPYCKNKKLSSTSGRNVMSDGLIRSENEIAGLLSLGLGSKNQKLIHGNQLTNNQLLILN